MKFVFSLGGQTCEFDVDAKPTGTIGRSHSCALRIKDHNISRVHAKYSLAGSELTVSDEGSRNGLFVNGLKVSEASVPLGGSFKLGDFEIQFAAGTNTTGPLPEFGDDDDELEDRLTTIRRSKDEAPGPAAPAVPSALGSAGGSGATAGGSGAAGQVASPTRNTPTRGEHPTPIPAPAPAAAAVAAAPPAAAAAVAAPGAPPSPLPAAPAAINAPQAFLAMPPGSPLERFALDRQRISIGSSPDNDLPFSDPKSSRYHAEIREVDNFWIIRDLGSRNGTLVNDARVEEAVLKDGDRITVGTTTLTFRTSSAAGKAKLLKVAVLASSTLVLGLGVWLLFGGGINPQPAVPGIEGGPQKTEQEQFVEFMETGTARLEDALKDGKFEPAERNYERAARLVKEAAVFLDVVKLFVKHGGDLTAMPWEELEKDLEQAKQIKDIPPKTQELVSKQLDRAHFEKLNAKAYADLVVLADGKKYEKALEGFKNLDARSLYKTAFQPKVKGLREAWHDECLAQVDKLIGERRLEDALAAIAKAQELSDILDKDLLFKKKLCEQNIEDSAALLKAKDLVKGGKSVEAGKLLEGIHKESFCYNEAQTLKRQVEMQNLTAEVKELYRSGDGQGALTRIGEAPEKSSELENLARKIELVLRTYQTGVAARDSKDFKGARNAGQALQDLEKDKQNFYHQEGVAFTQESPEEAAQKALKEANDLYHKNKFAEARAKFEEVLRLMPDTAAATDTLKKMHDQALTEFNRVNNARNMPAEEALKRLKEIVEWLTAEDPLSVKIHNRIRELGGK